MNFKFNCTIERVIFIRDAMKNEERRERLSKITMESSIKGKRQRYKDILLIMSLLFSIQRIS